MNPQDQGVKRVKAMMRCNEDIVRMLTARMDQEERVSENEIGNTSNGAMIIGIQEYRSDDVTGMMRPDERI